VKAIFLDVDGVLNTSETYINIQNKYNKTKQVDIDIDEFRLEYLKTIIDNTGAKVVLSSSWRGGFTKENNKVIPRNSKCKKFYDLLTKYNIELYDIIFDIYSDIYREAQINYWLSLNRDIDNFIILDDEPNLYNNLTDKLIKTSKVNDNEMLMNMDDCIGLCEEHIKQAINMLNANNKVLKK